jgi:hypothetical protein
MEVIDKIKQLNRLLFFQNKHHNIVNDQQVNLQ